MAMLFPRLLPLEALLFFGMKAAAGVAFRDDALPRAASAAFPTWKGEKIKPLIVTDAWSPQVNGVVRTLQALGRELAAMGHEVRFATPENHTTLPLPTYPEIRLALFPRSALIAAIDEFQPTAIHIATEGPLGFSARAICLERGLRFTTSFHTRFPEYVHARFPFIPEAAVFGALKSFHAPSSAVMAATPSLKRELETHGFRNVRLWSRGVDLQAFRPEPRDAFEMLSLNLPRPVFLFVGRVAVEKNVEAFLRLDLPGTKVVIGDGPDREWLKARYPAAQFLGQRTGAELAGLYASSDVFVFPSRTDTFGLVLLEALASGLPVAAYPVQAPLDVLGEKHVAVLDEDLRVAALAALAIPRNAARAFAAKRSWRASTEQFLNNLAILKERVD
jgi:glycosyltransferase involved in cell wall biosynthesis